MPVMFSSLNFPCLVSPVGCECWLSQSVSAAATVREGEQRTLSSLSHHTEHNQVHTEWKYILVIFYQYLTYYWIFEFLDCFSK